jgi:hypothetical protein
VKIQLEVALGHAEAFAELHARRACQRGCAWSNRRAA